MLNATITRGMEFGREVHLQRPRELRRSAEGEIDVYARLNGTMEWDTAAGQIILNEAGGKIVDLTTNKEIEYNRQNQRNNYFVASINDFEI